VLPCFKIIGQKQKRKACFLVNDIVACMPERYAAQPVQNLTIWLWERQSSFLRGSKEFRSQRGQKSTSGVSDFPALDFAKEIEDLDLAMSFVALFQSWLLHSGKCWRELRWLSFQFTGIAAWLLPVTFLNSGSPSLRNEALRFPSANSSYKPEPWSL